MQHKPAASAKTHSKTGHTLAWIGALIFLGESAFILLQLADYWQSSGAATIGVIAALGLALQKLLTFFAWNHGLLLAAMAKVLVLCCPLAIIFVGMLMTTSTNNSASLAESQTLSEGDGR
jgi:hypothetical protein